MSVLPYRAFQGSLFVEQRVHLSFHVGENANDYKEIAARDKLSELQLRVRQLLDQVEQITKEQNYQRVGVSHNFLHKVKRYNIM